MRTAVRPAGVTLGNTLSMDERAVPHCSGMPRTATGESSLARAVRILESFTPDEPELSVTEIARRAGLHVATASRLVGQLVEPRPAQPRARPRGPHRDADVGARVPRLADPLAARRRHALPRGPARRRRPPRPARRPATATTCSSSSGSRRGTRSSTSRGSPAGCRCTSPRPGVVLLAYGPPELQDRVLAPAAGALHPGDDHRRRTGCAPRSTRCAARGTPCWPATSTRTPPASPSRSATGSARWWPALSVIVPNDARARVRGAGPARRRPRDRALAALTGGSLPTLAGVTDPRRRRPSSRTSCAKASCSAGGPASGGARRGRRRGRLGPALRGCAGSARWPPSCRTPPNPGAAGCPTPTPSSGPGSCCRSSRRRAGCSTGRSTPANWRHGRFGLSQPVGPRLGPAAIAARRRRRRPGAGGGPLRLPAGPWWRLLRPCAGPRAPRRRAGHGGVRRRTGRRTPARGPRPAGAGGDAVRWVAGACSP